MRLNQREKDIIVVAGINADSSVDELAKLSGYPSHTVRYSLEKLISENILRRAWIIDIYKLGWTRFNIFFSTTLQNSSHKKKLLHSLSISERTAYLSETTGDFDYELALLGKNAGEVLNFIYSLDKSSGGYFFSKSVSTRRSMALFPRKYLSSKSPSQDQLAFGGTEYQVSIDHLDHLILKEMATDAFASLRDISKKISIPVSTIEKRVIKLKRDKVILGAVYSTNPKEYGSENFTLMLFARGFNSKLTSGLHRFAKNHPHCTYFIEAFGAWDYELGVEVENHDQLVQLREAIGDQFGDQLIAIKTLTRLKVHKYNSYPLQTFLG